MKVEISKVHISDEVLMKFDVYGHDIIIDTSIYNSCTKPYSV